MRFFFRKLTRQFYVIYENPKGQDKLREKEERKITLQDIKIYLLLKQCFNQ